VFPDGYILERRLRQLQRLPWLIPANVIVEMTELDFDMLDMARDRNEYWRVLTSATPVFLFGSSALRRLESRRTPASMSLTSARDSTGCSWR
jgi:hypothetical protein